MTVTYAARGFVSSTISRVRLQSRDPLQLLQRTAPAALVETSSLPVAIATNKVAASVATMAVCRAQMSI